MRYKQSWLGEVSRFERCIGGRAKRNDLGLRQFFDYESRGIVPEAPDAYFRRLLDGKRWWEWTINEYADLYGTNEWPGWLQLEYDFQSDSNGLNQIRNRLGLKAR